MEMQEDEFLKNPLADPNYYLSTPQVQGLETTQIDPATTLQNGMNVLKAEKEIELQNQMSNNQKLTSLANMTGVDSKFIGNGAGQMSAGGAAATGMIAQVGVGAMKALDKGLMGDKNFGAQSEAIDSAVHGVSSALMSSGNPYAMAAGAALEGANFLTKAGGQTVQGFDVDIASSGYGTLNHMESTSSRDFGAAIGLGGLNRFSMEKKLARRNQQARMALEAADIAQSQKFEQEARMNSVDNVLRNNQIALAGGIDTNLLGA